MAKDLEATAEHVNNLFNVDNPDLVDVTKLSRDEVHQLKSIIDEKYPKRYFTGISIEFDDEDVYALSIRRDSSA